MPGTYIYACMYVCVHVCVCLNVAYRMWTMGRITRSLDYVCMHACVHSKSFVIWKINS